ncbi:MAG: LysR family transcriptional regulator [Silicimonas sp.]|nr:LysR family transcriptional regulator [Silicimonas sp.]
MDYFVAFEAAAKLGSFARASDEMRISETAISRKVRLLEQHYNLPLFVRGHRSITLTEQGAELLVSVQKSLKILRDASQDLLERDGSSTVILAATNSVAALWLMPRLSMFSRSNGRVKIKLMASDSDSECLSEAMDLTILRGDGDWPGFESQLLFGETVFPVCAPSYLRTNPTAADLASLPNLDLIEVDSAHREWMRWRTWLDQEGVSDVPSDRGSYFNTYPLAIQAAVDGHGIALGWGHLVDHLLESGELVRPLGATQARTSSGYYLLKSNKKPPFPEQEIVENWLLGLSATRVRYGTGSEPQEANGPATQT